MDKNEQKYNATETSKTESNIQETNNNNFIANAADSVIQQVSTVTDPTTNFFKQSVGTVMREDISAGDKFLAGVVLSVDTFLALKSALDFVGNITGLADKAFISIMDKLRPLRGQAWLPVLKQMDPVLGVDMHSVVNPVPMMPHVYIGVMYDPKDFLNIMLCMGVAQATKHIPTNTGPVTTSSTSGEILDATLDRSLQIVKMVTRNLGATVTIGPFLPRVVATTPSLPVEHVPMGGGFTMPHIKKTCGHAFLGSLFVNADGKPLSGAIFHLHNDCWDFGVPPVAKMLENAAKKLFKHGEPAPPKDPPKDPRIELYCPSGIMMSIPCTKPVFTNPIPTPISPTAAVQIFVKAGFQKLGEMVICKLEDLLKNTALGKKLGGCDFWTKVSRKFGTGTSHPADVAEGFFYTSTTDFSIPGIIPLIFKRNYNSYSDYQGPLGTGWHHSYDIALAFDREAGFAGIRLADGRTAGFEIPAAGNSYFNRKEKMWLHHHTEGYFYITDKKGYVYRFTDKEYQSPYNTSSAHLIQSISNRNGYSLRFSYHTDGILSNIIDTAGRIYEIKNDGKGHITQVIAPSPEKGGELFVLAEYTYDPHGRLIQQTNALGHSMHFAYEGSLLIKETWRNGLSWHISYDKNGKDARCTEICGDGKLYNHRLEYITPDCTKVTNSLGEVTLYYHRKGLVTKRVDPNGGETKFRYNDNCEMEWSQDALGNTSTATYDELGNLINKTGKDGAFIQLTYENPDFPYLPTSAVDAVGGRWSWEYDTQGNMVKRTDPLQASATFDYHDGLLEVITGARGEETRLRYDHSNNLTGATSPDGGQSHWWYDELGRCIQRENEKGGTASYQYDLLGQMTEVKLPDGNIRRLTYDAEGNVVYAKDNDREVFFTYRGVNKLSSRTERGATLRFSYDTEDQLRAVINEEGEQYRFILDKQGQVIEEIGFDGLRRTYTRDLSGRILEQERPGGDKQVYEYDEAGRVTHILYNPDQKDFIEEMYEYRQDGLLTKAVNQDAEVIFERDLLGRVIKETCNGQSVESSYDPSGNRIHITSTLGANIEAAYNLMGDVMSLSAGEWSATYGRDLFGLETHRSLTGGIETWTERDLLGRVTNHKTGHNNRTVSEKSYLWGTNDKLLSIIADGEVTSFEYDGWGNLSKTIFADGTTEWRNPDRTGNLFESLDRMDRKYTKGGQLVKTARWEYKYDKEGNLIRKRDKQGQTWRYAWNQVGMLASVKRPDGMTVSFKYDALGRRVEKRFGKNVTRWLWDGNIPLHEQRESVYADYNKEQGHYNRVEKEPVITWVFDEGTFVPTAKLTAQRSFSIVTNYLGTPEAMYDEEGTSVWSCQLNSYGKVRTHTGAYKTACPFRYQGQYEDAETGLYYNRFRYYSPEEGVYISQDPIGLLGNNLDLYGYVKNPNTFFDVFGLNECKENGIETPWGTAEQENSPEALAAAEQVENGATLYRIGTLGMSETTGAQFWALEHPFSEGYADRYGIPPENIERCNFITTATLTPGSSFVTRSAPGFETNKGGGIEVVVPEGGARINTFSMLDKK